MILLHTTIQKLEEKEERTNWHKGPDGKSTYTTISKGWYVQFTGSTESIKLWDTEPDWKVGDAIKITFGRES